MQEESESRKAVWSLAIKQQSLRFSSFITFGKLLKSLPVLAGTNSIWEENYEQSKIYEFSVSLNRSYRKEMDLILFLSVANMHCIFCEERISAMFRKVIRSKETLRADLSSSKGFLSVELADTCKSYEVSI